MPQCAFLDSLSPKTALSMRARTSTVPADALPAPNALVPALAPPGDGAKELLNAQPHPILQPVKLTRHRTSSAPTDALKWMNALVPEPVPLMAGAKELQDVLLCMILYNEYPVMPRI